MKASNWSQFLYVVSTLIAITDKEMLDKNIASTLTPLTEKEREVQEEIERRFFQRVIIMS